MASIPELLDELSLRVDDAARLKIPSQVLHRLLSRAQSRVARETLGLRTVQTITLVADQAAYDLHERFLKEYDVIAFDSAGNTARIPPRSPLIAHGVRPASLGSLTFYYLTSASAEATSAPVAIVLWPAPSTGGELLDVRMARDTAPIQEGDQTLELPVPLHDAVLFEALTRLAELPGAGVHPQLRQEWKIEREQLVREARASVTRLAGNQAAVPVRFGGA